MPAKYPDQIREAPEPEPELPGPGAGYEQNLEQSFTFTFQTDQYPAHESIPASTGNGIIGPPEHLFSTGTSYNNRAGTGIDL